MSLTTPAALQERLAFIGLDASAVDKLTSISPHVSKHLPLALDRFYAHIATVPAVRSFFPDGMPQMKRAQDRQVGHWSAIASGKFDGDYAEASKRIGMRHAKIGLEPRWYVGGYGLILETLVRGVVHDSMAEILNESAPKRFGRSKVDTKEIAAKADVMADAMAQMLKAVMVDIDMAVTVYFDKLTADAAEQAQRSAAVVSSAVDAAGAVLRDLAAGELTTRVTAEFDPSMDKIKHDTNAVAESLTNIVTQLRDTSGALKVATGEILAGSNNLSERTTQQAAAIEETSAAMEQLAQTVNENAKRADEASSTALSVSRTAADGGEVMASANQAMERITTSSSKISNIIGMIDDISFQTNLLALNASVEAARAGEAGKGFAVVAIEVRRLAQSAAQASSEVKVLVDQSAVEVNAGSKLVAEAAEKLLSMLKQAEESSRQIAAIANANREQSQVIDEINIAIRQMDEMTQHNAALVEQTNAAVEQTEGQASELDLIVDIFNLGDRNVAQKRRKAS